MTEILFIGDIHGKWKDYQDILEKEQPERSIQVGDFGWGFLGQESEYMQRVVHTLEHVMETQGGGDNRYIRGNHDNPGECAEHRFFIPDISYEQDTGMMFIGGADSIDKEWRVRDQDWWPDEELSYNDLHCAIDVYESVKPRIMVTHECPEDVVWKLFPWYRKEYPSRTREALGSMWSMHKPDIWIFGHWHHSRDQVIDGTRFICLAELETIKIDT